MQHDWILDVLADVRTYAEQNRMTKLAEHIRQAELLAQMEIAAQPDERRVPASGH